MSEMNHVLFILKSIDPCGLAPVKPGLDGKRAEISPKQTKPYPRNRLSAQSRDLKRFGRFVIKIVKMPRLRNRFD